MPWSDPGHRPLAGRACRDAPGNARARSIGLDRRRGSKPAHTRPTACRQCKRWRSGRQGQVTGHLTHSSQGPGTRSVGRPPGRWVRNTAAGQRRVPGSPPRVSRHFRAALRHRRSHRALCDSDRPGPVSAPENRCQPRCRRSARRNDLSNSGLPRPRAKPLKRAPCTAWRALSDLPTLAIAAPLATNVTMASGSPTRNAHRATPRAPPLATLLFIFLENTLGVNCPAGARGGNAPLWGGAPRNGARHQRPSFSNLWWMRRIINQTARTTTGVTNAVIIPLDSPVTPLSG